MRRFLLGAAALFCLTTVACAKGGSPHDAGEGKTGQSGGTAGGGGEGGDGGLGGSGGGGSGVGAADGSSRDSSDSSESSDTGSDVRSEVATGGVGGSSGDLPTKGRTGTKSAGCGKEVAGATTTTFTNHKISIPACAPCTVPNCPSSCIAPPFVPGGVNAQTAANGENFLNRDFTIELPAGYDPNVPSPVFFGADGCGPAPPLQGAGFSAPGENRAIKVGLQQVGSCFADGGIRCAPDIANVAACVNGPEIPYFQAVMSWVEANFCVDRGAEFAGGGSS